MFCKVLHFEVYMFRDPSTPVVKQLFSENGDLPDLQDSNSLQNIKALARPYSSFSTFQKTGFPSISCTFVEAKSNKGEEYGGIVGLDLGRTLPSPP
jgi:hypothetical protein